MLVVLHAAINVFVRKKETKVKNKAAASCVNAHLNAMLQQFEFPNFDRNFQKFSKSLKKVSKNFKHFLKVSKVFRNC